MSLTTEREIGTEGGQRFIRWTRRILMLTGTLALAFVVFTLWHARFFQDAASSALDRQIRAEEQSGASCVKHSTREGDILGRIEIPRIALSVVVLQGTSPKTLRMGVGHIEGTALPGESGNIGIAGHRDTYFRALKDIHKDDRVLLQTISGIVMYQVDWIQITAPDDGGIMAPTSESSLTLVTCYPFRYIGAAPERFVVHAHRQ